MSFPMFIEREPEGFFEEHAELQIKLVKIDVKMLSRCHTHHAIFNDFRSRIFYHLVPSNIANPKDKTEFLDTQQMYVISTNLNFWIRIPFAPASIA